MIISLETQLDTIEIDLDDFSRLNADEMEAEIRKAFPEGLDEDELEALKAEILDELDELKDEWKDVLSGEKSELADAETPRDKAEHELNIEEIEEALDVLLPFEDSLDLAVDDAVEALDHEKLLNVETADNLSWTSVGLQEGDEVTMKCTGIAAGSGSIWGDKADDDELTDGEDEDDIATYADYEARVLAATGTDLESVQSLTLGASGETYALASVADGTITLRVTDAQGQSFLLTIEGSPVLYFSPGVVTLDQVESWPETLANRCYEMGDTMSFGNHLYANSLSDEDKLAYVETYEEVVSDANFDAVWGVFYGSVIGYGDDIPRSELRPLYEESLKILYKYVNDPSLYSSMSDAWADVFQLWDFMGLNANDKRMVAEAMVLGVFQKGGEHFFQAFFQPVATILQNIIYAAGESAGTNSNAFDKTIQILLATHAGGTSTLWDSNFATCDETTGRYQSGAWGNHEENIEALELYQSLCANSGWAPANGEATTAVANEKAMIEQDATDAEEAADPMKKGIQISYDEMNALITKWNKICEAAVFSSSTADDAAKSIFSYMFNDKDGDGESDGPVPADDLRRFIIDAVNNYDVADQQDDMISIFMWTLHEQEEGVFNTLLEDASFKSTIYDAIQYDQWVDPYAADWLYPYLS